jgi:hypothetical protein
MRKSYVIIGTYNHLAEGAEQAVYEETYQTCWRPFLSSLYRFSDISATLHYSGTVLRWLEGKHPEFLMLLEEMVLRKQIELLGGGFFAPLLPLIPAPDRLGQIELLTTYIRKAFGKRPRGCWLQEYAWEPNLASTLQTCGFDFTFLPERLFREADMARGAYGAPVMTEDQGKSLAVFPVFDAAEGEVGLAPPDEALVALFDRHGELPLVALMYTGESARELWHASALESPDVLFERSFAALQRESLSLETTTPTKYLRSLKHFDIGHFPGSSSRRLQEKTRPPSLAVAPGSGSETRSLVLRREDSRAIYAKMQYVRILVSQLKGDKSRKKNAQEELWRAQCGDAYWGGDGEGLEQLPVRAAAYAALIAAEKITRQRGSFAPGLIWADVDFDGQKEILYQGADLNAYVHLKGGCLAELDSFRTKTNYVNALEGERDAHRGLCFQDEIFAYGGFDAAGSGLCGAYYGLVDPERQANVASLSRDTRAEIAGRSRVLGLRKVYSFRKGGLSVDFEVENKESDSLRLRFGTELNIAAAHDPSLVGLSWIKGHDSSAMNPALSATVAGIDGLRIENLRLAERIELRSDAAFSMHHRPMFLRRPSRVDGPQTECYQGCRILVGWDMEVEANASFPVSLTLELRA